MKERRMRFFCHFLPIRCEIAGSSKDGKTLPVFLAPLIVVPAAVMKSIIVSIVIFLTVMVIVGATFFCIAAMAVMEPPAAAQAEHNSQNKNQTKPFFHADLPNPASDVIFPKWCEELTKGMGSFVKLQLHEEEQYIGEEGQVRASRCHSESPQSKGGEVVKEVKPVTNDQEVVFR